MQLAQAAASAGANGKAATRWELSDERAALGEAPADVLGRLAVSAAVTSDWIERGLLRQTTGGLAGGTLGMMSGASGWFEKRVIGSTENLFGRLTQLASEISAWFEKHLVGRVEDMFSSLTKVTAAVSAGVENIVFQKGVQRGFPIAGHLLGRVLTRTEEILGHPLVIGLIFLFSIIALLVGAL